MDERLIASVQGQSQFGFTCIHTQKTEKNIQNMLFSFLHI